MINNLTFSQKVYNLVKKIPKGRISSYKAIAEKLNTKAYQAVGQALKHNPYAPKVPCHRVVKTNGSLGGYAGKIKGKKINKKVKLLLKEGVVVKTNKVKDFKKIFFKFK
jgi:methylated-DNA-[protein]-cysteine S-methyltransferase